MAIVIRFVDKDGFALERFLGGSSCPWYNDFNPKRWNMFTLVTS